MESEIFLKIFRFHFKEKLLSEILIYRNKLILNKINCMTNRKKSKMNGSPP